jgi:hypothetical protein
MESRDETGKGGKEEKQWLSQREKVQDMLRKVPE